MVILAAIIAAIKSTITEIKNKIIESLNLELFASRIRLICVILDLFLSMCNMFFIC